MAQPHTASPSITFRRLAPICVALTLLFAGTAHAAPGSNTQDALRAMGVDGRATGWVIYGNDDRHELCDEPDLSVRALADSTAVMIDSSSLKDVKGTTTITSSSFKEQFNLCSSERFGDQMSAGECSSFLVGPNLLVTAGHCITSKADCDTYRFVFGFAYKNRGEAPTQVPTSEVYRCKKIVAAHRGSVPDFALIRLDRKVPNHGPLALRRSGKIAVGTPLIMIGYPSGIPMKIDQGAHVRSVGDEIIANLDSYGGSSGSAVFNAITHEVEGILVNGETDYDDVADPDRAGQTCAVSHHCTDDSCTGEKLTPISHVVRHMLDADATSDTISDDGHDE